ncbi:hypothetical protein SAMD00019534_049870 [Acytostelium subglobosum LB1]|uniref:hypothetical protein n=1 Tax=Acytostelium subglobosum LB1 TaxID=1410327 RepID=UPI00064508EB|nr:hypothetical protein SAMD00019534_049870 [Acytostelium subglobosum LB1]GAM21812.1 hypothetical protein SAMD00019534_049870 [Acytostelium subglobosum LB1]|eukprot:XP_012754912.1 hypothetical protein SAMD00019534_049870 [Acytostelium subglobosum LB1]
MKGVYRQLAIILIISFVLLCTSIIYATDAAVDNNKPSEEQQRQQHLQQQQHIHDVHIHPEQHHQHDVHVKETQPVDPQHIEHHQQQQQHPVNEDTEEQHVDVDQVQEQQEEVEEEKKKQQKTASSIPSIKSSIKFEVIVGESAALDRYKTWAENGVVNVMPMTLANGTKFTCYIPVPRDEEEDDTWLEIPTSEDFEEALAPMELAACLLKPGGWWQYEYCHNKHIRQFHMGKAEKVEAEFSLGVVSKVTRLGHVRGIDPAFIESYNNKEETSLPDNTPPPYYAKTYQHGTPCDLVPGQRQTEVRFYCHDEQSKQPFSFIQEIIEPSSCHYIIRIQTSRMCIHPLFKPKKDLIYDIACFRQL